MEKPSTIQIASFKHRRLAQAFIDYMRTQGITLTAARQGEETVIWLAETQHEARVREELARFLREPFHERYQAASWEAGELGGLQEETDHAWLKALFHRTGPLTLAVALLTIAVFVWLRIAGEAAFNWLNWPQSSQQYWQIWRWISPMLLHFSGWQVLINLLWWWFLAGQIESRLGSGKLFTVTLIAALISGALQARYSGVLFGGLTGVIYALLGYCWWYGRCRPESGFPPMTLLLVCFALWLAVSLFAFGGLLVNAAPLAGLLTGVVMAMTDVRTKRGAQ